MVLRLVMDLERPVRLREGGSGSITETVRKRSTAAPLGALGVRFSDCIQGQEYWLRFLQSRTDALAQFCLKRGRIDGVEIEPFHDPLETRRPRSAGLSFWKRGRTANGLYG